LLSRLGVGAECLRALSDVATPVDGQLAQICPRLRGVPWFPAIGDGAASNLGSGATRPGLAAINVGTSAALRVMREGREAYAPPGLFCYRVDAARYLVGGAVSNAGNLRAWCVRELRLPDDHLIEAELAKRPGPVSTLHALPFWTAERAPTWNEDAKGALLGLTQHTTALDILQAVTEAGYQRLARIAELVLSDEGRAPKFIVSGGIQRSPQALQRLADVLGHPVHPNDEMEASIRGAAIDVIEKLGLPAPAGKFGRPVKPRRRYMRLYAENRARQRELEELFT
jgi:gluconokinase